MHPLQSQDDDAPATNDSRVERPLRDELFTDSVVTSDELGRAEVTLSLTHAPMVRIGLLANKYRQLTSRYYLREFGVGATDWRLLVVLTKSPEVSAGYIAELLGIDKAAVSRSLNALGSLGLSTDALRSSADPRIKLWRLTRDGQELHARMLTASLRMNNVLLTGFGEEDIIKLLELSDAMLRNLELLEAEFGASSG
ncbi:MarR family winged helix-turn-helix transcriptional regulator [Rhodococcus sp. H29-C3]|uniref:MarR family winged helix-turn-helix transcriptional regulator n=1 Tax=Rhodococcus sp. H29-C3 TaxID=3046307 RepID=UPI0024B9E422|nr:MarR family winged helix-turn-helix transcriptional regulator [Rhodococcus sp. H29-C3]MDJ0361880.1 MarR family winged helix-turn-helix transcriptional regulator [Rhodococcus sp. H29-C3]